VRVFCGYEYRAANNLFRLVPTTVHVAVRTHDNAFRVHADGVGWLDQAVPFQVASTGPSGPPTAEQAVADVHDTALSVVNP
jgi:hypothetical protein